MKKLIILLLVGSLAGCSTISKDLQAADTWITKYGPLVGKDILLVDDILIGAYCSPALNTAGQTVSNVLNIVAPSSNAATRVANRLATNVQITDQLCPAVALIKEQIATVTGSPSQSITTLSVTTPNPIPIAGS